MDILVRSLEFPDISFTSEEANGWSVSDGLLTIVKDGKKVANFSTWVFVRFVQPQKAAIKEVAVQQ